MSTSLVENSTSIKSPKVWNVPSQKTKYLILGNQHDKLEYDVMGLIRIVPKKGHPVVFSAKIRIKTQDNPECFIKFIRIPKNLLPFMPEDIKLIDVEIIKSN